VVAAAAAEEVADIDAAQALPHTIVCALWNHLSEQDSELAAHSIETA